MRALGIAPALAAIAWLSSVVPLTVASGFASGCGGAIADVPSVDAGPPDGRALDAGHDTQDAGDHGDVFDATFPSDDGGPSFPFDAECKTSSTKVPRVPTAWLFAIDGSASISNTDLLSIAGAVDTTIDAIAKSNDASLKVGLFAFGDIKDQSCILGGACDGPYPGLSDVSIAFVDAAQRKAVQARFDSIGAGGSGSDPLFAAITGGISSLSATPAVRKGLFLVTAGYPTDGTAQATVDAVTNARAKSPELTVFVAGAGPFPSTTHYDPALLGQIASAGGSALPGCNPLETTTPSKACYAQLDGSKIQADLTAAIRSAIKALRCTIVMPPLPGGPYDPHLYNLELSGPSGDSVLPLDPANGWTFDDPTSPAAMILHGASCDVYVDEGALEATILTGCASSIGK